MQGYINKTKEFWKNVELNHLNFVKLSQENQIGSLGIIQCADILVK